MTSWETIPAAPVFNDGVKVTAVVPVTIFPVASYKLIFIGVLKAVFFGYTLTVFNLIALVASNVIPANKVVPVAVPEKAAVLILLAVSVTEAT